MDFSFFDSDDEQEIIKTSIEETINEPITEPAPVKKGRGRPKKGVSFATEEIPKNDFLMELEAPAFIQQQQALIKQQGEEKEMLEFEKQMKKTMKKATKEPKELKEPKKHYDDGFMSDEGSEILGREKRILLTKVRQYKNMFQDELKTFRIKKNATNQELKAFLDEMEVIVSTSNCDSFLTDGILNCIKLIEGVSSNTKKYNITGLSDMLKANKEFHNLIKQMYIKYGCFDNVPPEAQLVLIIATTAYICRSTNLKREELNQYLNQPMNK